VDDRVDPAAAAPATAGSTAAQADTVVRKKPDTKPGSDKSGGDKSASAGDSKNGEDKRSQSQAAPESPQAQVLVADSPPASDTPLVPDTAPPNFTSSVEPHTVSRNSPVKASAKPESPATDSGAKPSSASGLTPPPASAASLASSTRPTSPRWTPAALDVTTPGDGTNGAAPDAEEAVPSTSPAADPAAKPSRPPSDEVDAKPSSAASLAAAALAADTPSSGSGAGYSPTGYSDYAPTGYSAKDSVWPSSKATTAGFPPAPQETRAPVEPAPKPASSIWTSQESVSGKVGYSPSGTQRPAGGSGAATAAAAGAGAVAGAAVAAGAQLPGRVVASKAPAAGSASATPAEADGLAAKLMAPFATVTKKRKPVQQPLRQGSPINTATPVKTRPATKRSPVSAPAAKSAQQEGSDSRRDAQLVISRIEPWSVMKFSFIVSLVGWIVLFVAVALLYYALRTFGVFHYLEQAVNTVTSSKDHAGSDATAWFSASTVLGYTILVGAINVVLVTALTTVGAVVYNLITHLSGGVEVTLREAD
jgi:Transmembrane domain of unknown function (DUF3566)